MPLRTGLLTCPCIGVHGFTPMPRSKVEVYAPDKLQAEIEDWASANDMSISRAWQYLARSQLQREDTK